MVEKTVWLVRNDDGMLCCCTEKPKKDEDYGYWETEGDLININPDYLPNIKWEDKEPVKTKLILIPIY